MRCRSRDESPPTVHDAAVGRRTLEALANAPRRASVRDFTFALRTARETYERTSYPWKPSKRDETSKFWRGLRNRWDNALKFALTLGG